MTYDALNRLTGKTYSDSTSANPTPWVTYSYQGMTDFLSSEYSSASSYTWSNYDEMGRPGAGTQTTGGQPYAFSSVVWTPTGQIASITYPSQRVVTTSFDVAGRISGVGLNGNPTAYAGSASYAAHGGLTSIAMGDGLTRTFGYNTRLQTGSVGAGSLLSLGLNWNANGTLGSQTIGRPGGFSATQSYTYDGVNRLKTAAEGSNWNQTYVYDAVGNRAVTGSSSIPVSSYTPQSPDGVTVPFNGNNQWAGTGNPAGYDGAGNTTAVRTQMMAYDAESRMVGWSDSSPSASVAIAYDGDGRRVTKVSTAGTTVTTTTYVYDPAGNLAAAGGSGTLYLTADHLGSTRLVTTTGGVCVGAHDYLPFGEEIPQSQWGRGSVPCYGQTDTAVKFTGQERDNETGPGGSGQNGLDNYLARFMASGQGRFLSPDPANAGADPTNPQSWNMYGYVANNPLAFVDPSGLDGEPTFQATGNACKWWQFWCYSGGGSGNSGAGETGGGNDSGGPDCILCGIGAYFSTTVYAAPPPPPQKPPQNVCPSAVPGAIEPPGRQNGSRITNHDHSAFPAGSVMLTALDRSQFPAPGWANFQGAYRAGAADGHNWPAQNADFGHWGTYDFQRNGATEIHAYIPAANYAVGIGLAAAGYSRQGAIDHAGFFAGLFGNRAAQDQASIWQGRGWDTAHSGACSPR